MTPSPALRERLRFLARVVSRECRHLETTDRRVFDRPFTVEHVHALEDNIAEAERVEAFVSRFGRLQDSLGDKLLPRYLEALGEPVGAVLDNLDRGERLGLIPSADHWFAIRRLRNQMVYEYIEDPAVLCNALQNGHEFVSTLLQTAAVFEAALTKRGWLDE
ncbi:MAG: hypothetical protein L0I62_09140 [Gammaproteobacteria bacterium]|nr:hypothetical protein [Gammaproteobacteria bacterium]